MPLMTQKFYHLVIIALAISLHVSAQNVAINEDGSAPDPNAILDVKSFTKGVLLPRVSSSGRMAIPNTPGLLVYDTVTKSFWYNNGAAWQSFASASSSGSPWLLRGNAGTTINDFIGTLDSIPLAFRVNNQFAGHLNPGTGNSFFGYNSGVADTSTTRFGELLSVGTANTAFGYFSLASNYDGINNTSVGFEALRSNTTAAGNTAVGSRALRANTTGNGNTGIGFASLTGNTDGVFNTAIGASTLVRSNSSYNTAVGTNTLFNNTGTQNTAVGASVLVRNTSGIRNAALGADALSFNEIGSSNTAIGFEALAANRNGGLNTAIGVQAMSEVINPFNNTVIGALATTEHNTVNATAIGFFAFADASNKVRIGNNNVTVIEGQVPFTTPSDGRYKFEVRDDVKGLEFISKLHPVTYQFDVKSFDQHQRSRSGNSMSAQDYDVYAASFNEASMIRRSGFIAQDVENAAIESGYDFSGVVKPKTESDYYGLSYESFVVPLVKAVQELYEKVERLEKENELLRMQMKEK